MERSTVDVTNGGALVNKTSQQARNLIATMSANSQQFGIHRNPKGKVNKVRTNTNLNVQVNNLTTLLQ